MKPSTDPVERLRRNVADTQAVLAERWDAIAYAREQGLTWRRIGDALGMRPSGAHEWFTRSTDQRKGRR